MHGVVELLSGRVGLAEEVDGVGVVEAALIVFGMRTAVFCR